MNWTIIKKSHSTYPVSVSKYVDYKPYLRIEANHRCVYCGIKEAIFGGADSFHVEHFKPKSLAKFKYLEKDYMNLFYSCSVCNRFKSNDWYDGYQADHSTVGYPNPNEYDYNILFSTSDDFVLKGFYISSEYLVEKLYLNRPQLLMSRELESVLELYRSLKDEVNNVLEKLLMFSGNAQAHEIAIKIGMQLNKLASAFAEEIENSKYELTDIRKVK